MVSVFSNTIRDSGRFRREANSELFNGRIFYLGGKLQFGFSFPWLVALAATGVVVLSGSISIANGRIFSLGVLRPSKFEGHCPMIRHGCRMALMVALNWSVECVKEES